MNRASANSAGRWLACGSVRFADWRQPGMGVVVLSIRGQKVESIIERHLAGARWLNGSYMCVSHYQAG